MDSRRRDKVIDFIKSNLHKGYKVPREFQKYGEIAVNEMYENKNLMSQRRKLKYPSAALLEDYQKLGAEIRDSDGISVDSALHFTTSPNEKSECFQNAKTVRITPYLKVTGGLQTPLERKPDPVTLLC